MGDNETSMKTQEEEFMQAAIELAVENARAGRGPFGAIVVRNGALIASGANQVTTTNDPTAHAELVAIREACQALGHFQLTGCDLYASCEPCPMCVAAIYWARPAHVYYASTAQDAAAAGFDDLMIFSELSLPPAARRIPMKRLTHAQALAPFQLWQANPNRVPY
jgi:guanine deaminase